MAFLMARERRRGNFRLPRVFRPRKTLEDMSETDMNGHRRMGTLWLGGGGAEGLIAQNFTHTTGADTGFPEGGGGFHKHPPPLDIVCVTSFALRKLKNTPTLGHSQAPPLGHCPRDVICPPENTPLPPLLLPQKKDRRCPKNSPPPASYA